MNRYYYFFTQLCYQNNDIKETEHSKQAPNTSPAPTVTDAGSPGEILPSELSVF